MASAKKKSSSKSLGKRGTSRPSATTSRRKVHSGEFAVCVKNDDYEASLELRKIYQVLPDAFAEKHGFVRVIDESGEDYLFGADYFVAVELPATLRNKLHKIA